MHLKTNIALLPLTFQIVLLSGHAPFTASIITFMTIPRMTTHDLQEIGRQWAHIVLGEGLRYKGPTIDPRHSPFYKRYQNRLLCWGQLRKVGML